MYLLPKAGGGEAQVTVAILCSWAFSTSGIVTHTFTNWFKKGHQGPFIMLDFNRFPFIVCDLSWNFRMILYGNKIL